VIAGVPTELAPSLAALAPSLERSWEASLRLRFGSRDAQTVLLENQHRGPLRLIKVLDSGDDAMPAPAGTRAFGVPASSTVRGVDAVIVHPPGGLAHGDSLNLAVALEPGARVRCTTPGAQKWYRGQAHAQTGVRLGSQAQLEWLPQPTIVYDGAQLDQRLEIHLAADAATVGAESLVLGRRAMGERFARGWVRQSIRIARAGELLWHETTDADAQNKLWDSPAGWAGRSVGASVWALASPTQGGLAASHRDQEVVEHWRSLLVAAGANQPDGAHRLLAGATALAPGFVLAKLLGDDPEQVTELIQSLWAAARPLVLGRAARPLRLWAT